VRVLGLRAVSSIAAGGAHPCASDGSGRVWCWGDNRRGQVGEGPALVREPLLQTRVQGVGAVAAGAAHSCVIASAGVFCWGANDHHQLGGGTELNSPLPVRVSSEGLLERLALGRAHSCAVTADHRAVCWGSDELGQMGRPGQADYGTAVRVPGLPQGIVAIGTGPQGDYVCAAQASAVWCWGTLQDDRLGSVITVPTAVFGLDHSLIADVAVGDRHACALQDGRLSCWGSGESGQLGDGRSASSKNAVGL
jgi:alpha-tubulin suppressor-like RCC1 family protein